MTGAHALTEAGRIVDAEGIARFGYDTALNERVPLGVGWFGLELGRVQLLRGAPVSALTSFRAAANGFAQINLRPQVWWACGGALFAAATMGDPAEIAAARVALDAAEAHAVAFMRPDVLRARANAAVVLGFPSEVDEHLSEALDLARSTEPHTLAHAVIHDVSRLGDSSRALGLLDDLSVDAGRRAGTGACWLRACRGHAGRVGARRGGGAV